MRWKTSVQIDSTLKHDDNLAGYWAFFQEDPWLLKYTNPENAHQ